MLLSPTRRTVSLNPDTWRRIFSGPIAGPIEVHEVVGWRMKRNMVLHSTTVLVSVEIAGTQVAI